MVKKLWRYVKQFSSDTGRNGQTDGQTDRQICYINIARQYALIARDKCVSDSETSTCGELTHKMYFISRI